VPACTERVLNRTEHAPDHSARKPGLSDGRGYRQYPSAKSSG
jgi:hypothetical protein